MACTSWYLLCLCAFASWFLIHILILNFCVLMLWSIFYLFLLGTTLMDAYNLFIHFKKGPEKLDKIRLEYLLQFSRKCTLGQRVTLWINWYLSSSHLNDNKSEPNDSMGYFGKIPLKKMGCYRSFLITMY